MANTPSWIVPAPKSNTGTTPSWVVKAPTVATTTPINTQFDPTKKGKLEGIWDYTNTRYNGGTGTSNAPSEEYNPYIFRRENTQSGEDGMTRSDVWNEFNYEAMPNKGKTKYGTVGQNVEPVKSLEGLSNPSQIYFDDNYGWVTPKSNIKQSGMNKVMGNGAMIAGLAMGGLMGAALPAGAITSAVKYGFKALPSLASGSFDPVSLGLGALGASGYVPSWVVPAANAGRQGYSWITQQGKG